MKKFLKIFLAFFVLPILWFVSSKFTWIQKLESYTVKLRYYVRGDINEQKLAQKMEKTVPNIICVDINDESFKYLGEAPIPVSYYAKTMYALQKYAKSPIIATDIFFGEKQYSCLVDAEKVKKDAVLCNYYFSQLKNCIIGGWFNCNKNANQVFLKNEYPLPLIKEGFVDFQSVKAPILPSTNIVGKTVSTGMLNVSVSTHTEDLVRWIPLYARTQQGIFYNLGVETLHRLLNPNGTMDIYGDDSETEKYGNRHVILLLDKDVAVVKQIPLLQRQLLEINWFSTWETLPNRKIGLENVIKNFETLESGRASFTQKHEAENFFRQFDNAIVFLSNTYTHSIAIKTMIDSEKAPAISAHLNAFKTVYYENYIQETSNWVQFLILLVINFFIASLTLYADYFLKLSRYFISFIVLYFLAAFYLFGVHSPDLHILLPIIPPLGTVLSFWGLGTFYQLIVERRQRIKIKHVFSNYLSPQLVSAMLEQQDYPQLGGVERNLTAFFSDIQSFSSFSEVLPPNDLVRLMNEYLSEATNIITEEGGNLDKYIGDAVVAMFGAPFPIDNHPINACIAACRIQDKQAFLRQRWMIEHPGWPKNVFQMRTRIGLCSGNAVVGNMGSSTRFDFTMMGDTVNIGARCESGAKSYGVYTLVAEDTYNAVIRSSQQFTFRFIDRIVVKGRKHPLGVYELLGITKDLKSTTFDCVEHFEKGIHYYLSKDWERAIRSFEQSAVLEPFIPERDPGISTNPSLVYIDRCRQMQQTPPPENWDGVFVMKTK